MSKLITTEAIVLKSSTRHDTSRLLVAYTKEMGSLNLVAKGSRNPKSRLGASLEPFVQSQIVFYFKENRDFFYISQSDMLEGFINLRRDLNRLNYAAGVARLMLSLCHFQEKNVAVFNLLFSILTELNRSAPEQLLVLSWAFQIKLLSLLGFQPVLDSCANCQNSLQNQDPVYFSASAGGSLCSVCGPKMTDVKIIHPTILEMFRHFLTEKFSKNKQWVIKPGLIDAINKLLQDYAIYHAEREVSIPHPFSMESKNDPQDPCCR